MSPDDIHRLDPFDEPETGHHGSTRPTRSARAATKKGSRTPRPSGGRSALFVAAAAKAVGKPAHRLPPDRRARRAPLRRGGHERHAAVAEGQHSS